MRPPKIRSAFTRWAVLTRSGSSSSTVTPPRRICTASRASRTAPTRRTGGRDVPLIAIAMVATSIAEATTAMSRCPYSISTSARSGGINRPWHSGQSGQARPDPVALTILPSVMRRNTVATVAPASTCPGPAPGCARARPRSSAGGAGRGAEPPAELSSGHGGPRGAAPDVIAAGGLPAEEDHRDGQEEHEATRDPHDQAAQVLVGVSAQAWPHPGRRGVVRVEDAVRHGDEDRDDHHGKADHEQVEQLHRVGRARQLGGGRQHGPPQEHRRGHDHEVLDHVDGMHLHGQIVERGQVPDHHHQVETGGGSHGPGEAPPEGEHGGMAEEGLEHPPGRCRGAGAEAWRRPAPGAAPCGR